MMAELATEKGLDYDNMPDVYTCSSFQSDERKFVILDTTISSSQEKGELGLLADKKLTNVMITRARQWPLVVGCKAILEEPNYSILPDRTIRGLSVDHIPAAILLMSDLVRRVQYNSKKAKGVLDVGLKVRLICFAAPLQL